MLKDLLIQQFGTSLLDQLLLTREKSLGSHHVDSAIGLSNLKQLLLDDGRAQPHLLRQDPDLDLELQQLQQKASQGPLSLEEKVQLASTLHNLDFLRPDGGSRVPEAVALYKHVFPAMSFLPVQGEYHALSSLHV